ncbi:penicillin-binding protein activator [Agaribacter flavus]|uniref:Penicillin-binding protein activator n=1 Tax=Agaribacter flavus TaxID=1902781 RepID=A0ABV7FP93_9ALTE
MRIHRLLLACVISIIMSACGGTPKQAPSPVVKKQATQQQEVTRSPIEEITDRYEKTKNKQSTVEALLHYAFELQLDNNCDDSNTIVFHLYNTQLSNKQLAELELLRSECLLKEILDKPKDTSSAQKLDYADTWLANAKDLSHANYSLTDSYTSRLALANAVKQVLAGQYNESIEMLARNISSPSILSTHRVSLLWQALSQQTQTQRKVLWANTPSLRPYIDLLAIVEDDALADTSRQEAVKAWLQSNAKLEASEQIPSIVSTFTNLTLSEKRDIAVIIPLSGRLASQGNAIKQGILSAYYRYANTLGGDPSEEARSITFIDSGSSETLSEDVSKLNFEEFGVVVGPLLKSHIQEISDLIPSQLARVHLNSPSTSEHQGEDTLLTSYFALSPEQEAQELASLVATQGISKPIVIYEESNISTRMKNAFIERWSELSNQQTETPNRLTEVSFTDSKTMRTGITSALDVLQSKKRIDQLSALSAEVVHSVTRNRRDIEAFVVFASPQDLELLNPIIESSISLFSNKKVPVFATSYSYNHKYNKNSIRDLRNVVFIDMPFVQPEARNSDLSVTVDELYNQPSSTFLRLFAFGYDALTVAKNALQLKLFEQVSKKGLSGELSVSRDGLVNRRLSPLEIQDTDNIDGD